MFHPPSSARGNQSSLYEKLDPDLRKKLDRAIAQRQPPTLQACYESHALAALGVSRAAFYRYARRVRQQAELHHVAELVHPGDSNPARYLPELIRRQLIEMLLHDEQAQPLAIHRLVTAVVKAKRSG
jgi:hypothetical protein